MDISLHTCTLPNGETTGYRKREGGDVPIVLLHGNCTSSKHFDVVFESMDSRYTLYAMDMRGFGGSSYETPIHDLSDFADDVALFVDEIGLKSFHLAGWSTGGAVAMVYAANHPNRVRTLVLIESVSTRGWPLYVHDEEGNPTKERATTRKQIVEHPLIQVLNSGDTDAIRKSLWERSVYTHTRPDPERYDAYLDDTLTQRNIVDVFHALCTFNISNESTESADGTGEAADINVPTLVLRGDRDYVITEEMARTTAADIGENAEYVTLEDCGHSPFIDDRDQLLSEVTRFIQEWQTDVGKRTD